MFLPLLLIFFATLSAAVAVYGTLPQWVLYEHGISVIEWTRRLQWPLFTLSMALFLTLVVLIIMRRRRAWWLIGFGPLLALFMHQFMIGSINSYKVLENPPYRAAAESTVSADEYVVGVHYDDRYYAYPYRYLYYAPVIVQSERDRRYVLFWSAFANRATAWQVRGPFHARDLDIVSMPANSLLVYNARVGQFISGVTGLTPQGEKPGGFTARVAATKMTWKRWKEMHPQTLVMELPQLNTQVTRPVLPQFPVPRPHPRPRTHPLPATQATTQSAATEPASMPEIAADQAAEPEGDLQTLVVVIPSTQPIAILQDKLSAEPWNFEHDGVPMFIFRDAASGQVRVYDRRYVGSSSRFIRNYSSARARKHKVALLDVETNSGWTIEGLAVDAEAPVKSARLRAVAAEESLYWGVMKYWYPELKLISPETP